MTQRAVAALAIVVLCLCGLWLLPAEVDDGETGFARGAAMLPAFAILIIAGLVAADAILSTLARRPDAADCGGGAAIMGPAQWRSLALVVVAMAGFAAALPYLGYLTPSALLVGVLMYAAGARGFLSLGAMSLAAASVLYLGVRYGFGIYVSAWPDLTRLGV